MTSALMQIARADQFLAREHRLAHEDAECAGADYETREERQERQHRERTEDALIASAEFEDAAQGRWDAEDRRWREEHPQPPSEAAMAAARRYMDTATSEARKDGGA
jgi:hypothetical protein